MIREVVIPQNRNFTINIPNSYINKEVEFIMFPLDEKDIVQEIKKENKKSLRGVFNKYADNSKVSLEKNAWKDNIINKFKKYD